MFVLSNPMFTYPLLITPLVNGNLWGGQTKPNRVYSCSNFVLLAHCEHWLIPVWKKVKQKVQTQWLQHAKDQSVYTCSWHLAVLTVIRPPWVNGCCQVLHTDPVFLGQEWKHLQTFWTKVTLLEFQLILLESRCFMFQSQHIVSVHSCFVSPQVFISAKFVTNCKPVELQTQIKWNKINNDMFANKFIKLTLKVMIYQCCVHILCLLPPCGQKMF